MSRSAARQVAKVRGPRDIRPIFPGAYTTERKALIAREVDHHNRRVAGMRQALEMEARAPGNLPSISEILGRWSMIKLASACDLHKTTVGKYFRGECLPGFVEGVRMSIVLKVDPKRLCDFFLLRKAEWNRLTKPSHRQEAERLQLSEALERAGVPAEVQPAPSTRPVGAAMADHMGLPQDHPLRRR